MWWMRRIYFRKENCNSRSIPIWKPSASSRMIPRCIYPWPASRFLMESTMMPWSMLKTPCSSTRPIRRHMLCVHGLSLNKATIQTQMIPLRKPCSWTRTAELPRLTRLFCMASYMRIVADLTSTRSQQPLNHPRQRSAWLPIVWKRTGRVRISTSLPATLNWPCRNTKQPSRSTPIFQRSTWSWV